MMLKPTEDSGLHVILFFCLMSLCSSLIFGEFLLNLLLFGQFLVCLNSL